MQARKIGPYRIEDKLGAGGMGEVFRAYDDRLDRRVAIKLIRPEALESAEARQRFRREARAAARLSHPSIVRIHDILVSEQGDSIVMELVEGRPLSGLIAEGPMEIARVLALGREIAEGLAEAHAKQIVHRDLKADNVMVTPAGHVKILDFGLAKRLSTAETDLSVGGRILGTLHAMSPEQAQGFKLDHRSDLFSLGTRPADLERALDAVRRARQRAPGDSRPLFVLFNVAMQGAQVDRAEEALREIERMEPGHGRILAQQALVLEGRGQAGEALSRMRTAVERHASWSNLMDLARMETRLGEHAGLAYFGLARYAEAAWWFESVLELEGDHLRATAALALTRHLLGESAAARELATLSLKMIDEAAGVSQDELHYLQAMVLIPLGRHEQAVAAVQQILPAARASPFTAWQAALIYALVGEQLSAKTKAREALQQGLTPQWFSSAVFDRLRDDPGLRKLLEAADLTTGR